MAHEQKRKTTLLVPLALLAVGGFLLWYYAFRETPNQRVDKIMTEARAAMSTFEYSKAEQLIKEAIEILPESGLLRHNLGIVYLKSNRLSEARQGFEEAVALYGADANKLIASEFFQLASIDIQERKYEDGEAHLNLAINADPEEVIYHTRLIDLQLSVLNKPAAADTSTRRFLQYCGPTARNLTNAAHVHWNRRSYGSAIVLAKEALAREDSIQRAHEILADSYWKAGQPDSGLAHVQVALKRFPQATQLWVVKANLHIGQGNPKAALAAVEEALEIDPRHYQAHISRMMAFYNAGDYEKAIQQAEFCQSLTNDENELRFLGTHLARFREQMSLRGTGGVP